MTESFTRDPLTGAFTRPVFEEMVRVEIEKFKRYGVKFSLVLVDLDHFKEVNDVFGHKMGDILLVKVVKKLKELLRESDVIGRWGGDEFILLLPYADEKSAMRVAKRIIENLKIKVDNIVVGASCAFVTPADAGKVSYEKMFVILDELLYRAKRQGRGRIGNMLDIKDRIIIPSYKFVAREEEYNLLRKYAKENKDPFVIISGETGIGKSRLVAEFLKSEKLSYIKTTSFGPVSDIPLFAIKNLLMNLFRKDREFFISEVGKFSEDEKDIVGIFIPSLYRKPISQYGYQKFFLVRLADIIKSLLSRYKIDMLWIDDLQWLSLESLEVIKHLVIGSEIRIIATLRKEERKSIDLYLSQSKIPVREIEVSGLNRESAEDLLLGILGEDIDDVLVDYVYRYSGGVPFYIEEIVSFLAFKGFLQEQDNKIYLDKVPDTVPASLEDIIAYKLRNFDQKDLKVLWFVAIYHKPIEREVIVDVLNVREDQVESAIQKAIQAGIFMQSGKKVYFLGEVVRRAIIKKIPRGTYKTYHRLAAELKEKEYEIRGIEPFELYNHFKEAGNRERMTIWAIRSGKEAQSRFSPERAFQYYKEAFLNAEDENIKREALLGMVRSGRVSGKIRDTIEIIEEYGKDFLENYMYHFYLGSLYVLSGKVDEALMLLKTALENAQDDEFRTECMFEIAWVYRKQGRLNDCIKELERILEMNLSLRMHTVVLALYGGVLLERGDIQKAEEILKKVIEEGEKTHSEYRITSAYINYALARASVMDYEESEKYYKKAIEISERNGEKGKLLIALNNIGTLYLSTGKLEEAEKYYIRALDIAKETGNHSLEVIILNNLGSAARERGLYQDAFKFYMETLNKARKYDYPEWVSHSISNILMTYANYDESLKVSSSLVNSLEQIVEHLDVPNEKAYAFLSLLDYYRKEKEFAKAKEYVGKYKKLPGFIKEQYQLNFYVSMARFYDALGNKRMSNYYIKRIELMIDKIDYKFTKAELYKNIGDWYFEHKSFKKAKIMYRKANKLSRWLSKDARESLKKRMEELNESS